MASTELQTASLTSASGAQARRAFAQRAFAAMGLMLLAFAALWPATQALLVLWEDTERRTYTHGHVVVLICLWLLWRDRARWAPGALQSWLPALALLAAGSLLWLVAWRAGIQVIGMMLVPLMAAGAFVTAFGWKAFRRCWFAFAFLFLSVPIWDAVLPLLQYISVQAVKLLLRLSDIPAYFAGNAFQIPSGVFEIADGCSGLHFFVVGLTVSLLHGEVMRDSWRTRVKMVLLALLMAMATNWLRIYIIVLAGYLTDMQHRLVTDEHYSFGWFMFAGMMVLYFLIVRRWPASPEAAPGPEEATGPALPRRGLALAVAGLMITPGWLLLDANRASDERLAQFVPSALRDAAATEFHGDWQPQFPAHDREWRATALHDGADLQLYAVAYAEQRQGKELTGHTVSVLGASLQRRKAARGPGEWLEIEATDTAGTRWLVWYSYQIDGRGFVSASRMQVYYGLRSLVDSPASSLVALRTRCAADQCAQARAVLNSFVGTLHP